MSKGVIRLIANVLIATAVMFFMYGLIRVIAELPAHERVRGVATVLVVAIVLGSFLWLAGSARPKE